ncbi:MAG TPA: tetratricopeptide repeat protein, partial [Chloroflexota bacterium]|nr:tetratricopeptide repeat protein [Chloroflexota bacterium]
SGLPAFRSGCCPHLGLRGKPFETEDCPSNNHRCYLGASDRKVPLPHQQRYCLTEEYDFCPFLLDTSDEGYLVGSRTSPHSPDPIQKMIKHASQRIGDWLADEFRGEREAIAAIVPTSLKPESAADRARAIVDLESTLYRIEGFVPSQAVVSEETDSNGASFAVDEPTVDLLLQAGLAAARAGSYDEARETFEEALRRDPTSDKAFLWRAVTIVDQDDRRELVSRYETALDPELVDEQLIREGISAYGKRNRGWAQRCFITATELCPTNPRAWVWQARAASTVDESIAILEQYVDANPNDQDVWQYLWHLRQIHLRMPGGLTHRISDRVDRIGDWLLYGTWIPTSAYAVIAAFACLASSLLWLVPVVAIAGGLPMAEAGLMQISWLPAFGLPVLIVFVDGIRSVVLDLNLWVPLAVGLSQIWLALSIDERSAKRADGLMLVLGLGFIGAIGAVSNLDAQVVLIALNLVAVLAILLTVRERMNSRFGRRWSQGTVTNQARRGLS